MQAVVLLSYHHDINGERTLAQVEDKTLHSLPLQPPQDCFLGQGARQCQQDGVRVAKSPFISLVFWPVKRFAYATPSFSSVF
jgi:hypothetical protein